MKRILTGLIGIVIVVGVVVTGSYGLSQENIEIYESAMALQNKMDEIGFDGFTFTDYPLAFYDGERDYVITWEGDTYHITKRKALINFIAATAYPVENHYEVHTPTVEKMSSLVGLLGAGDGSYGKQNHIATLWHEAFHCYQLTNFLSNIEDICPIEVEESVIAEKVDTNEQAVELFRKQAALLEEAVKSDNIDKVRECIVQYKELAAQREALLFEEANYLEDYYTTVEGTACYIEACVWKMQQPEKVTTDYVESISIYGGGTGKYYKIGMAQCMILDKLKPDWKQGYDFSRPVVELIYEELEI